MRKVEVLRAACCVAGIDGTTCESERRILELLAREVGVGNASLDAMIHRAENEDDYFESQFRVLKSDPAATIKLLFSVALADGALPTGEIEVLYRLAVRLGISDDQFQHVRQQALNFLDRQAVR